MIKYSFAYVSVLNKYSQLKLRNSACAKKKTIARWCDDAITMVRWRDTNGGKEHRFIAIVLSHHRHRVIATLSSHCRNIASLSSHHRAIAIASSSSCNRTIAIALSYHRTVIHVPSRPWSMQHRTITIVSSLHRPKLDGRWYDCELRGPISGFHTLSYIQRYRLFYHNITIYY